MLFINSFKEVLTGFLFFTSLFIISISCDSTEPTDELKPGRRDYNWTVDTLDTQMNRIQSIWGSNPYTMYGLLVLVDYTCPNENLWHFDGNIWQLYSNYSLPIAPVTNSIWHQQNIFGCGNDANIYALMDMYGIKYIQLSGSDTKGNWIDEFGKKLRIKIYAIGLCIFSPRTKIKKFYLHFNGLNWNEIYFS